jgi:transcription elongation factor Elf1
MEPYGQFNPVNNRKVKCNFPCAGCGKMVKEVFPITKENHKDAVASCPHCDKPYDVTILHDAGSGTVTIHDNGVDQKNVMAEGIAN